MRYAIHDDTTIKELKVIRGTFTDKFGVSHPVSYLYRWDEAYKNSRGIYEIVDTDYDDFEFIKTGSEFSIIDNKAVETAITSTLPLVEIKEREKQNVTNDFVQLLDSRPRVDSGLGFFVDGGRADLDNFEQKEKRMSETDTTIVKDADNQTHEGITKAQMRQISDAIFANGEAALLTKWQKQKQIDAATTIQEVRDAIQ